MKFKSCIEDSLDANNETSDEETEEQQREQDDGCTEEFRQTRVLTTPSELEQVVTSRTADGNEEGTNKTANAKPNDRTTQDFIEILKAMKIIEEDELELSFEFVEFDEVFSEMPDGETEEQQTEQDDECTEEPEQTLEGVLKRTPSEAEQKEREVTTKSDGNEEGTNKTANDQRSGGTEQDCAEIVNTNTMKNENEIFPKDFVTGDSSRETDSADNLNRKECEETQPRLGGNEEITAPNEKQNEKIGQSGAEINEETGKEYYSRRTRIFRPKKPSIRSNENVVRMLEQGNNPFITSEGSSKEQKSSRRKKSKEQLSTTSIPRTGTIQEGSTKKLCEWNK